MASRFLLLALACSAGAVRQEELLLDLEDNLAPEPGTGLEASTPETKGYGGGSLETGELLKRLKRKQARKAAELATPYGRIKAAFKKRHFTKVHWLEATEQFNIKEAPSVMAMDSATTVETGMMERSGQLLISHPQPIWSILDETLYCRVSGAPVHVPSAQQEDPRPAELAKQSPIHGRARLINKGLIRQDFPHVSPGSEEEFLKGFAFYSKVTARMHTYAEKYPEFFDHIYQPCVDAGDCDEEAVAQYRTKEMQHRAHAMPNLPELLWKGEGLDVAWPTTRDGRLSFACNDGGVASKLMAEGRPQPFLDSGITGYQHLFFVRPQAYVRSVSVAGVDEDGQLEPVIDIKGIGFPAFSLGSGDPPDNIAKADMNKIDRVSHASGIADTRDIRFEFVIGTWILHTMEHPMFQALMERWCGLFDEFYKQVQLSGNSEILPRVLEMVGSQNDVYLEEWEQLGVDVSNGCPTFVTAVKQYGVLEFGDGDSIGTGLDVKYHYGQPDKVALLLRQVSVRMANNNSPDVFSMIPNKYALVLQLLLYSLGGVMSLCGFGARLFYWNMQADIAHTQMFDFGHFSAYSFTSDGALDGRRSDPYAGFDRLAYAIAPEPGVDAVGHTLAKSEKEVAARLSSLSEFLTNIGGNEMDEPNDVVDTLYEDLAQGRKKLRDGETLWYPGHKTLFVEFSRFIAKTMQKRDKIASVV